MKDLSAKRDPELSFPGNCFVVSINGKGAEGSDNSSNQNQGWSNSDWFKKFESTDEVKCCWQLNVKFLFENNIVYSIKGLNLKNLVKLPTPTFYLKNRIFTMPNKCTKLNNFNKCSVN